MRRYIVPVMYVLLTVGTFGRGNDAHALPCDYPIFVQQNAAEANVLFIFDSSGSMTSVIYHEDYDGQVTYPGPFASTTNYSVSSAGDYSPDDFLGNYDHSPTAPLVPSENGQASRYRGNYLNWVYYHATDQQRAEIPQVTRIEVEKAVLAGIVQQNANVRFGVMRLNGDIGGQLVSAVGSDPNDLIDNVNAISADGPTPLAETMVDALEYLQDSGYGAPIQYECQKTFIVLLTDGSPTRDLNVPAYIADYDNDGNDPGTCESIGAEETNSSECSDYLDDVAAYLHDTDLRPDLDGQQNAVTYTIGFSIDIPLLQEAANNGGGLYFTAGNAEQLQASLGAVFTDILSRVSAGTGVALISNANSASNRLYRAKFIPGFWKGFLEAFEAPYSEGDYPLWEAGQLLEGRSPASRTIYTWLSGSLRSFDTSSRDELMPYLNVGDPDVASDIIDFVRGEDIAGYRDRQGWKLGDIVGSSPVVVAHPAHFYDFGDYVSFVTANASREPVIYVGANDGMLHCFRASDGHEMWAYIPRSNLGKLNGLAQSDYCHDFFVNGTPKAADVQVNGNWKTVLFCGQGEGGDGYFALDVTVPETPELLWDVSLPLIVESRAIPQIARVANLDEFIAFVGSGPDEYGDAHLVALNMDDGSVEWSDLLSSSAGLNMSTAPAILDMNLDGYDDLLYVSDMAGQLWRFDLTTNPWTRSLLFQTGQPIQARPTLTVDEQANVLVYFGTGKYTDANDVNDTSTQTFYCIIDNHSGTTVSVSDLVDQTSSIGSISGIDRGWYLDLVQGVGERVTEVGTLAAGVVYFTSFSPNAELCGAGGQSWLYALDYEDGSSPDALDGSENDTVYDRTTALDEGISSQPVFDLGTEDIIIQSSDAKLSVLDARSAIQRLVIRSWREVFE